MTDTANSRETPLYNSRIIDNYIKLIRKHYSHIDVNDLLTYAGMKPYEVADQGHWFTQVQINLFQNRLSQLTNNVKIAREAGRFGASPEASGVMRQFFLGMVGPASAYEMISKGATNFTRSTSYQSKRVAPNKVEITVKPVSGVREKPFQCENRMGYLEAIAMMFGNKLPRLEHPECVFNGGSACRYVISWEKRLSDSLKSIRNVTSVAMLPLLAALCVVLPFHTVSVLLPSALAIVLALTVVSDLREKKELRASLNNLKFSTDQLVDQINHNYNNALMTNEIGQAISGHTSSRDILFKVIQIFKKRLDFDRCMILLADKEKKRLLFRAGFGYTEQQLKLLKNTAFHLDRRRSRGLFVSAFKEQKPFLVNDIGEIEGDLSSRSLQFAKRLGAQAFICCPIIADSESIGILAVDNLKSKKPLVHSDMSLMIGIASVLGISIRNADLLESRERQFRSILHALAASIDARDPMTSGHSEKVTEYALGICEELELDQDYREVIRVAALLHDYGKIGVPDAILKKPGRLTDEEYEIVKTHAEKTRRILNQISFEGIYSQVPEIAGCHHEKVDGSGYPEGLVGDSIPLGARIIAVADFFEAITARRHYRDPMQFKKAFELLMSESGKRLDSKVVEAFCRFHEKSYLGEQVYKVSVNTRC
jgi:HD-GYP domain-containing protein (c-di-GMP phosphodiesterase class II)